MAAEQPANAGTYLRPLSDEIAGDLAAVLELYHHSEDITNAVAEAHAAVEKAIAGVTSHLAPLDDLWGQFINAFAFAPVKDFLDVLGERAAAIKHLAFRTARAECALERLEKPDPHAEPFTVLPNISPALEAALETLKSRFTIDELTRSRLEEGVVASDLRESRFVDNFCPAEKDRRFTVLFDASESAGMENLGISHRKREVNFYLGFSKYAPLAQFHLWACNTLRGRVKVPVHAKRAQIEEAFNSVTLGGRFTLGGVFQRNCQKYQQPTHHHRASDNYLIFMTSLPIDGDQLWEVLPMLRFMTKLTVTVFVMGHNTAALNFARDLRDSFPDFVDVIGSP